MTHIEPGLTDNACYFVDDDEGIKQRIYAPENGGYIKRVSRGTAQQLFTPGGCALTWRPGQDICDIVAQFYRCRRTYEERVL